MPESSECLIVGAGVVGLSLAWELARRGRSVRLLDRAQPGQEASWAGAGILTPGRRQGARTPLEQLLGLSNELHAEWSRRLADSTGVDNGYRGCGGLYLLPPGAAPESLAATAEHWRAWNVEAELLSAGELAALEPNLRALGDLGPGPAALHLTAEAQIRNPWHLRALLAACRQAGVAIEEGVEVLGFERRAARLTAARTSSGPRPAERFCVCGGSWSARLLAPQGVELPIEPVRGQIVLFRTPARLLTRIVNVGKRYLVPREDGRLLAGSTEERAGFEKRTTDEGIAGLVRFAQELAPPLAQAEIERTWAGLRPGTPDELPFLGPLPGLDNAWVAAGHFRAGLQLSPGTAAVIASLMQGEPPPVDLQAFSVERGAGR